MQPKNWKFPTTHSHAAGARCELMPVQNQGLQDPSCEAFLDQVSNSVVFLTNPSGRAGVFSKSKISQVCLFRARSHYLMLLTQRPPSMACLLLVRLESNVDSRAAGPQQRRDTSGRQAVLKFKRDDSTDAARSDSSAAAEAVSPSMQPEKPQYNWREQW